MNTTNRIAKYYQPEEDVKLVTPSDIRRTKPLMVPPDAMMEHLTVRQYLDDCELFRRKGYEAGYRASQAAHAHCVDPLRLIVWGGYAVGLGLVVWGFVR